MEPAMTEPVSATYHVFINHRGCDVKKTLASLIYDRLTEAHGLRVFLDEEELLTGDHFPPAIFAAIQSSSVDVAIFSPRYAESRWCLDELCWILDKPNRKIIPVFYDVEPTDLRHIDSGPFKDAFKQHQSEGRVTVEVIEKWKTALNKASEISGIECGISGIKFKWSECDQGKVLGKIVNDVLKGVKWEPLEVATYPVGLDPAVKEINDEIKKQWDLNGRAIVGIAGMAGLGKSTLAAHLYNLKRSDFKRSCFLSDIRNKDLPSLQQNLLRDLLGCDFSIKDTRQGKGICRDRLKGLRVLIVLDDADHIEQINSLLVADVVGSRSLILITSSDQDLLRRSSPKTVVYNVKPLRIEHARELFCWHAFDQSKPCEGFENMVEEALKSCDGVPLSLEVVGQQFRGFGKEYWKPELDKLSTSLPHDVMDRLKVSYEALKSEEEKEIFLDLGCFFVGEEKELAVQVFEGLGYKGVSKCLQNLCQKSLVKYHDDVQSISYDHGRHESDEDIFYHHGVQLSDEEISDQDISISEFFPSFPRKDVITMHDHISQMARGIAREEFHVLPTPKPLRLSCLADIEEMLKIQGGADSCRIRGIRTQKAQNLPDGRNYMKGVGVRLLVVEVPIDFSSFFGLGNMSGDLVWLRLREFISPFPNTISLANLRVLELNVLERNGCDDLEQLFQRFESPPQNLSVLNIDVTMPSRLRARRMLGTRNNDLTMPIGLRARRLRARRMLGTRNPPKSGEGTSTSSRSTGSYFQVFLRWIGRSIKNPTKIILKNITFLESLPIDFRELRSLRHLDLSGCTNLTQLPNSFSELMHLQYLALRNCINLSIPVDILGDISSLEYVDFNGCSKLKYLPTGITNQRSLICLDLRGTALELPLNMAVIPDKLQRLGISSCAPERDSFASEFWPIESLQPQLRLPEEHLVNYKREGFWQRFRQREGFWQRFRQRFRQRFWPRFRPTESPQPLVNLRPFKELKELNLIAFHGLKLITWEEIAAPNMEVLVIRNCPVSIFSFKQQGSMHAVMGVLRDFTLSRTKITEIHIPEGVLPSLETLDLSKNRELKRVEGLPSTLVRLDLQRCSRLEALISLSNLVNLKFLRVNGCYTLETLNVEGLTSLEEIQAEECWELKSIQGLSQRERLKCLCISTNTDVIWNEICNFLTLTSREELSTAFFSGKSTAVTQLNMLWKELQSIASKFQLKVVDAVFDAKMEDFQSFDANMEDFQSFDAKMEDFQSYGAVLMCFLTRCDSGTIYDPLAICIVKFEASDDGGSVDEYSMLCGYQPGDGVQLHVFVWTKECNFFRDSTSNNNIHISCSWSIQTRVERGWIMMVDRNTPVSQVCKEIIIALS